MYRVSITHFCVSALCEALLHSEHTGDTQRTHSGHTVDTQWTYNGQTVYTLQKHEAQAPHQQMKS